TGLARDREQAPRGDPERVVPRAGVAVEAHLARAPRVLDVTVAELAAVAQEHAVHRRVVADPHPLQLAVARARQDVAAPRAVGADRRREAQVPDAAAVAEQLVGEHAGGTHLDKVAGERALERALLEAAEVDAVAAAGDAEVAAAGVLLVEAAAAIAGDAAVYLVRDELAEVLVAEGALLAGEAADPVAGRHREVLELALAALVAHRAIERVVDHQPPQP